METFYTFFLFRYRHDDERFLRGKLIVNFALIEAVVCLCYAALHSYLAIHVPLGLFIGVAVFLQLAAILLRFGISMDTVALVVTAFFWGGFTAGTAYSGGIFSPIVACMALTPFIANLLIGQKAAKLWFVISLVSIVAIGLIYKDVAMLLDSRAPIRSLSSYMGIAVIVFYFTYLFHRSQSILLARIKHQHEKLTEQHAKITEQNDSLQKQRDDIHYINEQLEYRVKEIMQCYGSLEQYLEALLSILKNKSLNHGDFDLAVREITKTASTNLNAARVSLWEYEKKKNSIVCQTLFSTDGKEYTESTELLRTDYPGYFKALDRNDVIRASQADINNDTYELKDSYLAPRNIKSILDTPVFMNGELAAVLCVEHVGETRHWKPQDVIFAQAMADLVCIAYRSMYQKEREQEIRELNESLETRVRERTRELMYKNLQLAEYAFINSHLLRAPLSSILGLIELAEIYKRKHMEADESFFDSFIDHLKKSGQELDDVVGRINKALLEGTHFSRGDLI